MKLFIDDLRELNYVYPKENQRDWIIARTYSEAINALNKYNISFISFDHDLGIGKTGYDIAKYIEEKVYNKEMKIPDYKIHSANPVGKQNIERLMKGLKRIEKLQENKTMEILKRIELLLSKKENKIEESISTWTRALRDYKKGKKKNLIKCVVEHDSKGFYILTKFNKAIVERGAGKIDTEYPVYMTGKMATQTYFEDKTKAEAFAKDLETEMNRVKAENINDVIKKLQYKYHLK